MSRHWKTPVYFCFLTAVLVTLSACTTNTASRQGVAVNTPTSFEYQPERLIEPLEQAQVIRRHYHRARPVGTTAAYSVNPQVRPIRLPKMNAASRVRAVTECWRCTR